MVLVLVGSAYGQCVEAYRELIPQKGDGEIQNPVPPTATRPAAFTRPPRPPRHQASSSPYQDRRQIACGLDRLAWEGALFSPISNIHAFIDLIY